MRGARIQVGDNRYGAAVMCFIYIVQRVNVGTSGQAILQAARSGCKSRLEPADAPRHNKTFSSPSASLLSGMRSHGEQALRR